MIFTILVFLFLTVVLASNLDVLASVASSLPSFSPSLPPSFFLTPEQEAFLNTNQHESFDSLEKVLTLCPRFNGLENYFGFLFRLLQVGSNELQFWVFSEFGAASKLLPELTSLLDFSQLNQFTSQRLGIIAACTDNLALFAQLIKANRFDLNADYFYSNYSGNAIVLVKNRKRCFEYAINAGLDLQRPILDEQKREFEAQDFVKIYSSLECYQLVMNCLESKKLRIQTLNEMEVADILIELTTPPAAPIKPLESDSNWLFLKGRSTDVSQQDQALLNLLLERGPEAIARLVTDKPVYLKRPNFLSMLRSVLNEDFAKIALIYSAALAKTIGLLDQIKAQLQSDHLFSIFLLEVCKAYCNKKLEHGHATLGFHANTIIETYVQNAASTANTHNYADCPKKLLTMIAFYAATHDFLPLIEKVASVDLEALGEPFQLDGVVNNIYSQVTNPAILCFLLQRGVPMTPYIKTLHTRRPVLLHFLKERRPEINRVLKAHRFYPSLIKKSINHIESYSYEKDQDLHKFLCTLNK